jgi:nucleoside-diphosphate-sugar epimerase
MQHIETEAQLIAQMTNPSDAVREAVAKLDGDIMVLGIAGKMGPTLGELLVRAGAKKVIGVSRFSNPSDQEDLKARGIDTLKCDLLDEASLKALPEAPYIYLMAGHKFGATGNERLTWAMNAMVPGRIMQRFPRSRIVYVSSGNVYQYTPVRSSGASEVDPVVPIGEYAMSRLGGERLTEFYSDRNKTPLALVRLFYATELRYGILIDIAQKIHSRTPIDLAMGYVNQIWQGDANAYLAQMFPHCSAPAHVINMTGPDVLSVRALATELGSNMGIPPLFEGSESDTALLGDASKLFGLLGTPQISVKTMMEWVATWVKQGGPTLGKPTKYESRTGKF